MKRLIDMMVHDILLAQHTTSMAVMTPKERISPATQSTAFGDISTSAFEIQKSIQVFSMIGEPHQ